MWKIFKKLGFRKADELDEHINTIAVRWSWMVTIVTLLGWSLYGVIREGKSTLPMMILSLGLAVYFGTILIMRKRLYDNPQK